MTAEKGARFETAIRDVLEHMRESHPGRVEFVAQPKVELDDGRIMRADFELVLNEKYQRSRILIEAQDRKKFSMDVVKKIRVIRAGSGHGRFLVVVPEGALVRARSLRKALRRFGVRLFTPAMLTTWLNRMFAPGYSGEDALPHRRIAESVALGECGGNPRFLGSLPRASRTVASRPAVELGVAPPTFHLLESLQGLAARVPALGETYLTHVKLYDRYYPHLCIEEAHRLSFAESVIQVCPVVAGFPGTTKGVFSGIGPYHYGPHAIAAFHR